MTSPLALIILDGWGYREETRDNAVAQARTPVFDRIWAQGPHTLLDASGLAVGLPAGLMGNSEVGHLNLGAGRVVFQDIVRIDQSIREGSFFHNPALVKVINHARAIGRLHLLGLVSPGGVHSSPGHLLALVQMAADAGIKEILLHAFLDGRDTPPRSALGFLEPVLKALEDTGRGRVATISGRYYAMDRDKRWDRLERAYRCLVGGEGERAPDSTAAIQQAYARGENDEFVLPTVVGNGAPGSIHDGDAVIFFNFRPDRGREMTTALTVKDFDAFPRLHDPASLVMGTMTEYQEGLPVSVAFAPDLVHGTLGEYWSKAGRGQLRIAETEKYAHVTYFFNGGEEEPNPKEERILVQSPGVATYDLQPEMSAPQVTERALGMIEAGKIDLMVLNFANPDMVGHTGIMAAAISAIETVDTCLGRVLDAILARGGKALVTADHGNAELMVDPETGTPHTAHTTNPVPCILVGGGARALRDDGKLCDVAPTLLELAHLPQPDGMTGRSLLHHHIGS